MFVFGVFMYSSVLARLDVSLSQFEPTQNRAEAALPAFGGSAPAACDAEVQAGNYSKSNEALMAAIGGSTDESESVESEAAEAAEALESDAEVAANDEPRSLEGKFESAMKLLEQELVFLRLASVSELLRLSVSDVRVSAFVSTSMRRSVILS